MRKIPVPANDNLNFKPALLPDIPHLLYGMTVRAQNDVVDTNLFQEGLREQEESFPCFCPSQMGKMNLMLRDFYGSVTIGLEAGKVTHVETETRRTWRYGDLPEEMLAGAGPERPFDRQPGGCR